MPYTITLSDGITNLTTVNDGTIAQPLNLLAPSNCSLRFVGRGAVGFSEAMATNFVGLLQNFAGVSPYPSQPVVGQLFYNTNGSNAVLQLFNVNNTWSQILTTDSPFTLNDKDIIVEDLNGDSATLGCNGTITLIRADSHPWIKMEGSNGVNATILGLGTDKFGNNDLTVSTGNSVGAIWHSNNLNPFDVNANNVLNGYNTFTNTTTFNQINVNDGGATTSIVGGTIGLKNYSGAGYAPTLTLWSPQSVSSPNNASIIFTDPNLLINFTTGATVNSLLLNPSSSTIYTSNISTVYHTGNLSPIVQTAANQTITGNLNLTETLAVAGNGSFGSTGGSSTLTLNGLSVVTTSSILPYLAEYLPLSGGTLTGPLYGTAGGSFNSLSVGGSAVFTTAGGTLTGALNGTSGEFTSLNVNGVPVFTTGGGTVNGYVTSIDGFISPISFIRNSGDCDLYFQDANGTTNRAVISASETNTVLNIINYMGSSPVSLSLGSNGVVSATGGFYTTGPLNCGAITSGAISASGAIWAYNNDIVASNGSLRASTGAYGQTDTTIATLLSDFSDYNTGVSGFGYQRLPNGFTLQWGQVAVGTTGSTPFSQELPYTYVVGCFAAFASYGAFPTGASSCGASPAAGAANKNTILLGNAGGETNDIYWWALGI